MLDNGKYFAQSKRLEQKWRKGLIVLKELEWVMMALAWAVLIMVGWGVFNLGGRYGF